MLNDALSLQAGFSSSTLRAKTLGAGVIGGCENHPALSHYGGLRPVYMAVIIFGRLEQSVGVGVDGHLQGNYDALKQNGGEVGMKETPHDKYLRKFVRSRDEAFTRFVLDDDWDAVLKHFKKFGMDLPTKEKETVAKAGVYKALAG